MRSATLFSGCIAALATLVSAELNISQPLLSRQVLPSIFKPPQVFKNVNLVRTTNLDKAYPRETINVIIENVDSAPQSEYYLPFESGLISRVGGLEVKDKKAPEQGVFKVEVVEYDTESPTEFYLIHLPTPLAPGAQQTLSITYSILSALSPVPSSIEQSAKQYLQYTFSAYVPSAYETLKQKTKLKFPNSDVPDYTSLSSSLNADSVADPQKQGSTFTYGPYSSIPAGASEPISVRYEFTKPLTHTSLLERDIEISHWGGNLAIEERYWLSNLGASLKNHFSRVEWQKTSYMSPATSALKALPIPLTPGALNPYFTDDIGNVSTSRFRTGARESHLELKPRYPVFGGWKYSFRIGWDADLSTYLRRLSTGPSYVLRVPFLEGPRMPEGISYSRIHVRIILPEGATNVQYQTAVPIVSSEVGLHNTFMDTIGRTVLSLHAINLVDDWRERELLVSYEYPWTAGFRKPVVFTVGMFAVFVTVWVVGSLDMRIGKAKKA
ncbi:dolichyl-diphosphooligosaccharide--protein glycosyltransferas-like protein subunit 1 [Clohesyomyces aquaticus]|uniref:Dolichyl-diphosphooligosaccharide--protein glycosyltransferase subunit 1 n=1 Tax=Clohesyomyces aquaticus TaxID=1231657 RepID=A0A1Y1ZNI5_9PLEO|nr:dolichyl-diphosphooligosaccharide--protein glycosyltransferas-like protein subunit 1 [Clohesyomyces aquaticus]